MNNNCYLEKLHSLYLYPARYKWVIPNYIINKYVRNTKHGEHVFDPFAGSGTLAVEAYRLCINSVSWDINPIIEVLVDAKIKLLSRRDLEVSRIKDMLEEAVNYKEIYLPCKRLIDWYPKESLKFVTRIWAYYHDNRLGYFNKSEKKFVFRNKYASLYAIVALDITRKISYTDDSIYKYYRSKMKKEKIHNIIERKKLQDYIYSLIDRKTRFIHNLYSKLPKVSCRPELIVKGMINTMENIKKAPNNIAAVITSPPYMIAHEYIRSFKYDLVWLGVPYEEVKKLSRYEIPYLDAPSIEIKSKTYSIYREKIKELASKTKTDILKLYDNYFNSLIYIFDELIEKVVPGGYIAFFLGRATLGGIPIPIDKVFEEHLISKGLEVVERRKDKITKRRLFRRRNNRNPNGIDYEILVVMKKTLP